MNLKIENQSPIRGIMNHPKSLENTMEALFFSEEDIPDSLFNQWCQKRVQEVKKYQEVGKH